MTTKLLPAFTAVRLAWAISGKSSNDETTQLTATIAEQALKPIQTQAAQDPKENQYVVEAAATIQATLRSLDVIYWAFGLAMAGLGHVVHRGIVRAMRERTQLLYVHQDYERNLYYEQYVSRVAITLTSLYLDIDRIHQTVFGAPYPVAVGDATSIVEDLLRGVRPTMCKHAHKHMRAGIITPGLWTLCETGGLPATQCRHWEG